MRTSTQPKHLTERFLWSALGLTALVLASCGSNGGEGSAAASESANNTPQSGSDEAEQREEPQESDEFSFGAGRGVITVEGIDYSFEANVCYNSDSGFEASGPGETEEGIPFWASLSTGISTREDMLEVLPEANVDAFFGDLDSMESFNLEIELGKQDSFSDGDDAMANFRVDIINILESSDTDYTISDKTLSGTAVANDYNGVALDYGVTSPVSFSATCE